VPTFATLRMSNGRLLLRSLLSVIILPVSVAVLVPLYLVRRWGAPAAGWPLGDAATRWSFSAEPCSCSAG